jgi:hypothetical protein
MATALNDIFWHWNGLKHVYEHSGWPFVGDIGLNVDVLTARSCRVVMIIRQNALRRLISNIICRQTGYWIGSKHEFLRRLASTTIVMPSARDIRLLLTADIAAVRTMLADARAAHVSVEVVTFEALFGARANPSSRRNRVAELAEFISGELPDARHLEEAIRRDAESPQHRWLDTMAYASLPGIYDIDAACGNPSVGYLFNDDEPIDKWWL